MAQHDCNEESFFTCIKTDKALKPLTVMIDDPSMKNSRIRRFYHVLSGTKDKKKKIALNKCLVLWAMKTFWVCRQGHDPKPIQPNTATSRLKMLFAVFHVSAVIFLTRCCASCVFSFLHAAVHHVFCRFYTLLYIMCFVSFIR